MNIVRYKGSEASALANAAGDPHRIMREVLRWDPFREIGSLAHGESSGLMMPDVDVKETPGAFVFKADVPGLKEKDIEVSLTGNRLTLSGKREEERREEKETYHAIERSYGSFTRSFTLPAGTDLEHMKAELKDGVLTISVPKKPEVQPKRIAIVASGDKPQAKA